MSRPTVAELAERLGLTYLDYQVDCFELFRQLPEEGQRLCLYYKTGAGKSITSLSCVALAGYQECVVVAPPATHDAWVALGEKLGVTVTAISHAKFRGNFTPSRTVPIVADEFHEFGGQKGKGWTKLARIARGLKAPLLLCSATPNYNDAERCYCVQYILDPKSVAGGFLQFLYTHCRTRQNPFGMMPLVDGFLRYDSAAEYLAALPNVVYVPDDVEYEIHDVPIVSTVPDEFHRYGLDRSQLRIMASQMEAKHRYQYLTMVDENGELQPHVFDELVQLVGNATGPTLLFAESEKIAAACFRTLQAQQARAGLVTGKMTKKRKLEIIDLFRQGELDVLVGTATLATGTDGLDKICDTMVILNDTTDNAKRRQLVGRILPRGLDTDASGKQIYRLTY